MTATFGRIGKLTALALVGAVICALAQPAAATPATDLKAATARWHAAALTSYRYAYRKYCECHPDSPPETWVTVRGGAVVDVRHRPVDYSQEVPAEPRNFQFYWTMDGIFELIHSALGRGAQVRVTYDDKLGYPTELYIDYDKNFIGDELDLKLTSVLTSAPP